MFSIRLSKIWLTGIVVLFCLAGWYAFYTAYQHAVNAEKALSENIRRQQTQKLIQNVRESWGQALDSALIYAQRLLSDNPEKISNALKSMEESPENIQRAFYIDRETIYLPHWKKFRLLKKWQSLDMGLSENPEFQLAEVLEYQQKDYLQAVKIYEKFWLLNPNDFQAASSLGRCLLKAKEYDRSEKIYYQIYVQNPPVQASGEMPLGLMEAFQLMQLYQMQKQSGRMQSFGLQVYSDLLDEKWDMSEERTIYFKHRVMGLLESQQTDTQFKGRYQRLMQREREWQREKTYVRIIMERVLPLLENPGEGQQVRTYLWNPEKNQHWFFLITPHGPGQLVLAMDYVQWVQKYVCRPGLSLAAEMSSRFYVQSAGGNWGGIPPAAGDVQSFLISEQFPDLKASVAWNNTVAPLQASVIRRRWMYGGGFAIYGAIILFAGWILFKQLQLADLKADFISHVSHELKTPLTSIRMLSEMLADNPRLPISKRKQYYTIVNEETIRLSRLIENLLDISRIERKKQRIVFQKENLDNVLRSAVETFTVSLGKHPASVLQDLDAQTEVWIDRHAIIQVVLNLLDNAHKFSPQDRPIRLTSTASSRHVTITVEDQGVGMDSKDVRKIFRKFYQVKHTYEEKFKGVGLGLSIVKDIVRSHDGKIIVESKKGEGTRMRIILPRRESGRTASPGEKIGRDDA
jgi:two-component system phosphate regulon sensor histidine kinase PhoR